MSKPYQSKISYSRILSPVVAISAGSILLKVDLSFVHNFAGIVFYNEIEGVTPVQPSSGNTTYTIRLVVQPHVFQVLPNNLVEASAPGQVDWAGNTEEVLATFNSIIGATHAQIFWAGNSS